jgi:SAM-dependent methyltransferase
VECSKCGFVYVNPRIVTDELLSLYRHNYFHNKDYGYVSYEQEKRLRIKNFERWLNDTKQFLPPSANIRALDVGCAAGYCLDVMKEKGYDSEGIELDEKMSDDLNAAGYKVAQQPISTFIPADKFLLITMFDVIEHIADIDAAFNRIYQLLENEGILVIVTPDHNSFQRKLFGKKWFQYKPVEHINYFTRKTISVFAERNGFTLISHTSSRQYADTEFILNRLSYYGYSFLTNIFKTLFSILRFKNKFFYTDTGSLLAVFRKTS